MVGYFGQWLRVLRPLRRTAGNIGRRRYARQRAGQGVRPRFAFDQVGAHRCVACHLCEAACPVDCLVISAAPGEHPGAKVPGVAELDAGRCISCGLCLEACPQAALEWGPRGQFPAGLQVDLLQGRSAVG